METKTKCDVYLVEYVCDECQEGKMRPTAIQKHAPTKYKHRCVKCGHYTHLPKQYPHQELDNSQK